MRKPQTRSAPFRYLGGIALSFTVSGLLSCSDDSQEPSPEPSVPAADVATEGETGLPDEEPSAEAEAAQEADAAPTPSEIAADEVRPLQEESFRCRASGPGGRHMDLLLLNKNVESLFQAQWTIDFHQEQSPGERVELAIDGLGVAPLLLQAKAQQLEAALTFRGRILPKNLQSIRVGSSAAIGGLSCLFVRE